MESSTLLKYLRGGGGGGAGVSFAGDGGASVQTTTAIVTAVSDRLSESDDEDNADEGSFFDLEFTVPVEDNGNVDGEEIEGIICVEENDEEKDESTDSDDDQSDGENDRELKFTLSSASRGDSVDPNVSLSPSDDMFFKGRLVPLSETNSKPVSTTKSTKFRVLMLKLKKSSKSNVPERGKPDKSAPENPKQQPEKEKERKKKNKLQGKFFNVKFKVEEVPIVSLFTSSKIVNNKTRKKNNDKLRQDERGFSKEALQKYLKKVKPLYVLVSKRYGEKLGFPGHLSLSGAAPPSTAVTKSPPPAKSNVRTQKQVSLPARLRVVRKHLGKSKSAPSAVAASPPGPAVSKRRDDSLLQQQDGIQSAIMHCKKSFIACRDSESSSQLRSASDQSQEKSVSLSTVDFSFTQNKSKGKTESKAPEDS